MSTSVITQKLSQVLAWATVVILVLLPFHAFFTTWLGANFGHLDIFRIWKELLLIPFVLATFYLAYTDKKIKNWLTNSPLVVLILVYILLHISLGIFAISTHKVSSSALIYALLINSRYLIFFLCCIVIANKAPWLTKNWQKILLWPAVVVIIFGLVQLALPNNFLSHFGYGPKTIPAFQTVDQKPQYPRLQSTTRGANPLGAYLVVVITALSLILVKKRQLSTVMLLAISAIVLFYTYSRSAWLGTVLAIGVLVYLWAHHSKIMKTTTYWLLAAIIILTGLVVIFRQNDVLENTLFHTDQTSRSLESSNAVRTQSMIKGAKQVLNQPLGQGPGTAGPASFRNKKPRIAENYFIQIGQEVGLIGLGLFIAINILVAFELWQIRSQTLTKILLASLIGLTLVNMLSHAWADDTLAYIWWGFAGIALAPSVIMNKERKH